MKVFTCVRTHPGGILVPKVNITRRPKSSLLCNLRGFFVFVVFEVLYTIPMSFRIITNMLRRLKTFNLIKKIIFGHFGTLFKELDPLKMIKGSEISIVILRPKFTIMAGPEARDFCSQYPVGCERIRPNGRTHESNRYLLAHIYNPEPGISR